MLYDITLQIDYSYAAPSDRLRNLLRLLPPDIPGIQRVLRRKLTIDPSPDERRDSLDFFGNAMTSVVWHRPVEAVGLNLTARIERFPAPPLLDLSPPCEALAEEIYAHDSIGPEAPQHFLGASSRVVPLPEITAFARKCVKPGMTTLAAIEALGRALHREMRFDAEATTVDTTPAEAFAARHGVCQDFAHVMIAALRGIGIPAGYVSGFLRTFPPPGQPRLEGADAMHAWVRAWAGPDNGWVEFDPTNDQRAGTDYVTVAIGRDYADVAPVLGVMRSSGGQESRQAVDVLPLELTWPEAPRAK